MSIKSPVYLTVTTHGNAYSSLESSSFKHELRTLFPDAKIECECLRPDFNDYLVWAPTKAMARKIMWELGRRKSLRKYWAQKYCPFIDDETNETPKLYCDFFYRTESERKRLDEKEKLNDNS